MPAQEGILDPKSSALNLTFAQLGTAQGDRAEGVFVAQVLRIETLGGGLTEDLDKHEIKIAES